MSRSARDAFLDGADDDTMRDDVAMMSGDEYDEQEEERKESDRGGIDHEDVEEIVTPGAAAAARRRTHATAAAHPSTASIHPSDAVRLAQSNAMVLVLDLPVGYQFGVDYWSFTIGSKFKGMKMIPAGVHFIWTAPGGAGATSRPGEHMLADPDMAPRLGSFVWLESSDVWVRKWDSTLESLVPFDDEDEEGRYAAGARRFDFDQGQGSYPLNEREKWTQLTNWIRQQLVERLEPIDKMIGLKNAPKYTLADKQGITTPATAADTTQTTVVDAAERKESDDASMSDADANSSSAADSKSTPSSRAPRKTTSFYTRIPTVASFIASKHPTADLTERTQLTTSLHLDQSLLLEHVLAASASTAEPSSSEPPLPSCVVAPAEHDLLGEYQFAFVAFLVGQDYEGFEQWKRLTILFTSCGDAALTSHHAFFEAWLHILSSQLGSIPRDFFVDAISGENFMRPALQRFFEHVGEATTGVPESLIYTVREMREMLKKRFLWKLRQLPGFKHHEEVFQGADITTTPLHNATIPAVAGTPAPISAEEIAAYKRQLQADAEDDEYAPTIADE